MGVFKEELRVFEQLDGMQQPIYGDACDVGVRIDNERNATMRDMVRQTLKACYEAKLVENKATWGGDRTYGTSWRIFIAFAIEDGQMVGVEIRLSHNVDREKQFLSVDIQNGKRPVVK